MVELTIAEVVEAVEENDRKIEEAIDEVTGWCDGPESKYVVIKRLAELAEKKASTGINNNAVVEAIVVVHEEWDD